MSQGPADVHEESEAGGRGSPSAWAPLVEALAVAPAVIRSEDDRLLIAALRGQSAHLDEIFALSGPARTLWEMLRSGADSAALAAWSRHDGAVPRDEAERALATCLHELAARWNLAPSGEPQIAAAARGEEATEVTLGWTSLLAMARTVLCEGRDLVFVARGRSMRPAIPSGSRLRIRSASFDEAAMGEVVLCVAGERLLAHRVIARKAGRIVVRGDSAARCDHIAPPDLLGRVVARASPDRRPREWIAMDGGFSRTSGLLANRLHAFAAALLRAAVILPLRKIPPLRYALLSSLRLASGGARRLERGSASVRRRLDVARAGLMTTEDKDAQRRQLYARRSVREMTALDENVVAGLTLIEEVLLQRHPPRPGPMLVLGCGPGRECVALARRGFEVCGLDRDAGMLRAARDLAAREGLSIRFIRDEATDFDLGAERFETIVAFSGLYDMILPRTRRVGMLRAARRHLVQGGRVLLTFLSDYVPPGSPPPPRSGGLLTAINPDHERGDLYLLNEAVHVFPHPARVIAEAREAELGVITLFRDQRAYDRATRQVRGYAILEREA